MSVPARGTKHNGVIAALSGCDVSQGRLTSLSWTRLGSGGSQIASCLTDLATISGAKQRMKLFPDQHDLAALASLTAALSYP